MALQTHGLPFNDNMIAFYTKYKHWHTLDRELVENITRNFTAVISIYEVYAVRLLNLLKGLDRAAENISVAAFDWIANGEKFELTTTVQPIDLLIQKTFDILLNDNPEITKLILNPEIKIGNSTKPPVPGK